MSTPDHKSEARTTVWNGLEDEGVARVPFPPHGRVPSFEGAVPAAEGLCKTTPLADARTLTANPDAPQRFVRIEALRRRTDS